MDRRASSLSRIAPTAPKRISIVVAVLASRTTICIASTTPFAAPPESTFSVTRQGMGDRMSAAGHGSTFAPDTSTTRAHFLMSSSR